MATAEDQIERPQLRAEPGRKSLREQWADRAKARKLVEPVDMSDFPDEPPLFLRKLTGGEVNGWYDRHADGFKREHDEEGEPSPELRALRKARNQELICLTICDEDGKSVFEPSDLEDVLPNELYLHLQRIAPTALGTRRKKDEEAEGN